MSTDSKNDEELAIVLPTLEAPPSCPTPGLNIESFFGNDSLATKLAIAESFLTLAAQDSKFNDFVRDMLLTIVRAVPCEAGSTLEVNYSSNNIFFRSIVGSKSDSLVNIVIPMGQGIVGHVVKSHQPMIVSNIDDNELHLKSIQEAVGFEARNLVAVPIIIRGRVYGVIELLNRVGEQNFSDNDMEIIKYACEMAAKAVEIRLMIAWSSRSETSHGEAA